MGILRHGEYRKLWLAQVVSQFGDSITELAVIVMVALTSRSGWLVGLVMFAQLMPTAVFGVFMGPFADRKSPKWLMVGADTYRLVIVLLMIPAARHPLVLVALVALEGIGTALFTPARSAAIPQVVGEAQIAEATALSQGTWSAMRIAGPAAAGILLAIHNTTAIFVIDACTFFASAMFLASLKSVRALATTDGDEESYLKSLTAGVRQVVGMPALRFLLLLFIPATLSAGMFNTDFNVVLLQVFHVPQFHFGLLDSVTAAGTIVGALTAPLFMRKFRPSVLLLSTCVFIGISMVLVLGVNVWRHSAGLMPIYLWTIVVGYLNALLNVPLSSLFIGITPAEFRGRGGALLQACINLGVMGGILAGGWLSSMWNALTATTLAGIILVGTACIFPWFKGYRALHAVTPKRATTGRPAVNGENINATTEATS